MLGEGLTTAGRFMIYGATGYTGRLVAERARARGLFPILAGRNASKLSALATSLGLEHRVLGLSDGDRLVEALRDVDVVVNAAGPFVATTGPLVEACLRARTHYLDVSGEIAAFAALFARDADARAAGVMLLPGVGFVVAASDCLAAHVAAALPGAHHLAIGVSRSALVSRGSMRTLLGLWGDTVAVCRGRALAPVPTGSLWRDFDYGEGPRPSMAVSWADVFTAVHTTGIPNVEVYLEVDSVQRTLLELGRTTEPMRRLMRMQAALWPDGPSEAQRAAHARVIVAEAEDATGRRVRSLLRTPDAYTCTQLLALGVAERVLAGRLVPGFQTPARVYGPDLVLECVPVVRSTWPAGGAEVASAGPPS